MKSKKVMRSFRLNQSILDQLRQTAIQQRKTQTDILEMAIRWYVQHQK